jgi:hypothetical protein
VTIGSRLAQLLRQRPFISSLESILVESLTHAKSDPPEGVKQRTQLGDSAATFGEECESDHTERMRNSSARRIRVENTTSFAFVDEDGSPRCNGRGKHTRLSCIELREHCRVALVHDHEQILGASLLQADGSRTTRIGGYLAPHHCCNTNRAGEQGEQPDSANAGQGDEYGCVGINSG